MNNLKVLLCFVLMLISLKNVNGVEQKVEEPSFSGITFEILLAKLEVIQDKLVKMESIILENRETTDTKLSNAVNQIDQKLIQLNHNFTTLQTETSLAIKEHRQFAEQKEQKTFTTLQAMEKKLSGVIGSINHLNQTTGEKFAAMLTQFNKTEQTFNEKFEQSWRKIDLLSTKQDLSCLKINSSSYLQKTIVASCKENPSKRSGIYLVQDKDKDVPFLGYCEQSVFGGGWLVIQYRFDGLEDFNRNWVEYRNGFGTTDREFWLGLEHLHRLTSAQKHELLVELKDADGNYMYARYDEFQIGSEEEQYKLKKLGKYSGTTTDSLEYSKGSKFSTKDRDNDNVEWYDCAFRYGGAWWYNSCAESNLNGGFMKVFSSNAMLWRNNNSTNMVLVYSRMSIRKI